MSPTPRSPRASGTPSAPSAPSAPSSRRRGPATAGSSGPSARSAPSRAQQASRTESARSGRHQRRPLALITGATSGIGLATARDLAQDHDLILVARTRQDLEDLASALREETDATVHVCAVDLTDDEALAGQVAELELDCLEVLVHSAGIEAIGTVAELTPARWREVLDLDLVSVAHLTSLLLPALRTAHGTVVMINSGSGTRIWAGQGLYSAAKHALRALADTLREEERGALRVTTIYPGRVDTPMQRRIHAQGGRPGSGRSGAYRAKDHMPATAVAATVRLAISAPSSVSVEDLHIRPSGLA